MTMRDTAEDPASVWDTAGTSFARWRAGDPAALDELVRVMSPILWHVVRATGLDKEQSEDVVQTAWLALVRNAHTVGDPQAVARWLCTTARREAWRVSKNAGRSTAVDDESLEWHLPSQALAGVGGRAQRRAVPAVGVASDTCPSAARSCCASLRWSHGPTTRGSRASSRCPSAASARPAAVASTSSATSSNERERDDEPDT